MSRTMVPKVLSPDQSSRSGSTWELFKNAHYQAGPTSDLLDQKFGSSDLCFNNPSGDSDTC